VRHDDLMGAIDGGLCVVSLDEAASWLGITRLSGSVKLRCALSLGSA